jgi:hypothetical protein
MGEAETVLRAAEIAGPLVAKLIAEIASGMKAGKTEEEATREALARLAAEPDLVPVLPDVERIIAEAREE